MSNPWLVVVMLGLMSICMATMTVALLVVVRELRQMLKRVNAMLVNYDGAIREARHVFGQVRQILRRANNASRHVESVIHKACKEASEAMERMVCLKKRAGVFLAERFGFGDGARSGPRRRR